MAIVNVNGISGINSITAQSTSLNFYTAVGNTLSIGASVSGNITGNVTGNVAGNVTGNLSGNVNATGLSTFSGGLLVGTGASISSPATNVLTLGTNNAERIRIDSSGNFGLGTNNPSTKLEIVGSYSSGAITTSFKISGSGWSLGGGPSLEFGHDPVNYPTWVTGRIASTYSGSSWGGGLKFFYNNGTTAASLTEGMELTRDGNLAFPSGKGIDFSATTDATGSSSELLSDYEEGVHTVTLKRSSGGTTLTQGTHYHILSSQTTSNSNQYRYIKIGNVVHLSFTIRFLASEAGQNGRYNISLPYSIAGNNYSFAGSIGLYSFNQTLNQGTFIASSATSLDFFDLGAGNGTHGNLYPNSGAEIYFNGHYFTI